MKNQISPRPVIWPLPLSWSNTWMPVLALKEKEMEHLLSTTMPERYACLLLSEHFITSLIKIKQKWGSVKIWLVYRDNYSYCVAKEYLYQSCWHLMVDFNLYIIEIVLNLYLHRVRYMWMYCKRPLHKVN